MGKERRGGVQKAEADGSRRSGEEVAAIELHSTLFRVRMEFMVQGSAGGALSKMFGFFFSRLWRY